MLAQAARWRAKNSPFCRELGKQRAVLLQALRDRPARCCFFCGVKCQDNVGQLCQRGRDGREGEKQPSAPHILWSLPQRASAARRVFPREKGRLSRPCPTAALRERHGAQSHHRGGFVQPPRCCLVSAPCPAQQSPPEPRAAGHPRKAQAG